MDDLDDYILALADNQTENGGKSNSRGSKSRRSTESRGTKRYVSEDEDSDDVDVGDASEDDDDEDSDEEIDEYGPDLYKDEEDKRRLLALPEVEREQILSERSEERQRNLERLEVRKLLKDGRKDDSKRRSTRTKETGASRALTELARRREEKKNTHTRSSRRESMSPDRKRRRRSRSRGSSDDGYSVSESESEEDQKKDIKRTPTLDEINAITLTRRMVESWIHTPFFEETAVGCYVRLFIGPDPQTKTPVYRLCEIVDVIPWHKTYKVAEGVWSNKAVKARHGKAQKPFPMDIISNGTVTQQEYARFLTTIEVEKGRKPNADDIENKKESLKAAREYILNDKEVADMIAKKRELNNTISNVAMEKAMLHTKLEQARSDENHAEVDRIQRQITDLEERATNTTSAGKLNIWADLNKKNREKDKVEMKEAEKIALIARKKLGAVATDPFARRRTTPKLVHTPGSGTPNSAGTPTVSTPNPTAEDENAIINPTISEEAVAIGQSTSTQSGYEQLVSKVAIDIDLGFDDDD
ncbi:hypothetical protein INT44_008069 [Umbelopsis vinacea]|uniref:Plus3 domain-containing protein n=1 Tax=Umbelopsis vinacea TaxID=44442 RepID=A0A8H7PNY9_9FUNG|nr:hypothetical protein INT44_008069 [Umbelopsis vinacea]KAI9285471.1 hypothetical protein BC943DRAFT_323411 [Umbelopsis sp. AD052]